MGVKIVVCSSVSVGVVGAAGIVICPRIAPVVSSGVITLMYHEPAVKFATSVTAMALNATDQVPVLAVPVLARLAVSATSFGPVAPGAPVSISASVASLTPVVLRLTVTVFAIESTVIAATPVAVMVTGGTSCEPASVAQTTV